MKTKSAKAKGRRLQDWVRNKLIKLIDNKVYTHLDEEITTAIMGEHGADVKISNSVHHLFPFSIECKNQEKYSAIYNAIDQARNHSRYPPIVFLKMNRREPLVVLEAEQFLGDYFEKV
tara:strand:+ start:773 stop:1126 length:354 start_codon:yes stop_codon:yes gene_type:complete